MNRFGTPVLFGLFCFGSMSAMASEALNESSVPAERTLKYSASPMIGNNNSGQTYFLINSGDSWKASRTGNLSQKGVERVYVNNATGTIYLAASAPTKVSKLEAERGPGRDNKWECYSGLGGNGYRNAKDYSICSSDLTKGVTGVGGAIIGSLNMLFGTVRSMVAVDQERLFSVAKSSGLIDMVEQDIKNQWVNNYHSKYNQATSSRELQQFIEMYRDNDPDGLVLQATQKVKEAQTKEAAESLANYRQEFESASTADEYRAVISKYQFHDPEKLIPNAQKALDAQLARTQKAEQEQAAREKKEEAEMAKKFVRWQNGLKVGDNTNCGEVLEIRHDLVKVNFPIANYGNEQWIKKSQIQMPGAGCSFVNGHYAGTD